ncbi:hypothetical protein NS258_03395 [Sphingomonas sanguinis]|uniref:Uncharacterized protein n=1 Tax=Sphingomonas sanguinis TaxID=33051 RepID=A0A147JBK6_9SPHN|nr:hypothetical protein NS258_03395 [Sphingomonas sanguinis]
MLAAALGPLLPAVEKARQDRLQTLRLEKAIFEMARDQMVEFVHADRTSFTAGLALPRLGRAGVIGVLPAIAPSGAKRHRAAALGAEADAGQQRRPARHPCGHYHRIAGFETGLNGVERLPLDQRRHRHHRHFTLRLLLAILMRARVEPVLADIGRAGQDRVDLR